MVQKTGKLLFQISIFMFATFLILFFARDNGFALEPDEVYLLVNTRVPESLEIAEYYAKRREIPLNHVIKLSTQDTDICSREVYRNKIVPTVRKYFESRSYAKNARCLVTIKGIPIRIAPPQMTRLEKKEWNRLKKELGNVSQKYRNTPKADTKERQKIKTNLDSINRQIAAFEKANYRSAFDSELALLFKENYPEKGWIPNPYFMGFRNAVLNIDRTDILFVSRLDGPDKMTVKRIIDDSIEAEKKGLKGTAYFDARRPYPKGQNFTKPGLGYYDLSIHKAANVVQSIKNIKVVINASQSLFQPGTCLNAILYCGWYSRGRYIDAFEWNKGAIGYHIASAECATLRAGNSKLWCKNLISKGVSATLGAVGEPYLQAFPPPELFFKLLTEGELSLVECYMVSLPYLSWQMILVGDPLYKPFKTRNTRKGN